MQDMFEIDGQSDVGWQRFYIEGSGDTAGWLWYCGEVAAKYFAYYPEEAGSLRPDLFVAVAQSKSAVTFCLDSDDAEVVADGAPYLVGCSFCDCAVMILNSHKSHN